MLPGTLWCGQALPKDRSFDWALTYTEITTKMAPVCEIHARGFARAIRVWLQACCPRISRPVDLRPANFTAREFHGNMSCELMRWLCEVHSMLHSGLRKLSCVAVRNSRCEGRIDLAKFTLRPADHSCEIHACPGPVLTSPWYTCIFGGTREIRGQLGVPIAFQAQTQT